MDKPYFEGVSPNLFYNAHANAMEHLEEELVQFSKPKEVRYEFDEDSPYFMEIPLYNHNLSREDNFSDGTNKKYILVGVDQHGQFSIDEVRSVIPDQFSKCLVKLGDFEEHSEMEFLVVDYNSLFGTRLTTFIKYDSAFFSCDERVFFEALLIKYKAHEFKPFFWSREVIYQELGIKKDRANRIISRFESLGILSKEVKKRVSNGRPQQVTYFNVIGEAVMDLLPQIFGDRDLCELQHDIEKYLKPIIKKQVQPKSQTRRMQ
jgi:hypothetical protein